MIIHDFQDPQQTSGALCWPLGGGAFIQWWWLWICTRTLRHVAWELEKWTDTGGMFFLVSSTDPKCVPVVDRNKISGKFGAFWCFSCTLLFCLCHACVNLILLYHVMFTLQPWNMKTIWSPARVDEFLRSLPALHWSVLLLMVLVSYLTR